MRILIFLFVFSLSSLETTSQSLKLTEDELMTQLAEGERFKLMQFEKFKNPEKSPLHKDSITSFSGLTYFSPVNDKYIVKGHFEPIKNGKEFEMKTSTDRLPIYLDFAVITFELDGNTYRLHAYQNVTFSKMEDYENELFIPFNDHTNGIETYGGGRYLDVKIPEENEIILNFNMAYNPYCTYNDRYSCPIPPDENKLEVRIKAGVLKYH